MVLTLISLFSSNFTIIFLVVPTVFLRDLIYFIVYQTPWNYFCECKCCFAVFAVQFELFRNSAFCFCSIWKYFWNSKPRIYLTKTKLNWALLKHTQKTKSPESFFVNFDVFLMEMFIIKKFTVIFPFSFIKKKYINNKFYSLFHNSLSVFKCIIL